MTEVRVSSPEKLRQYLPQIHAAGIIAVRLETTGNDAQTDRIGSLLLAVKDGLTLVLDNEALNPDVLQELFSTSAVKVFYDAKVDLQFLLALGILPKPLFDALLSAQLLSLPDDDSFHALIRQYLDEDVNERNDAQNLLRLREVMVPLLYRNGLAKVAEIEFHCVRAVAHIEYHGIHLERAKWQSLLEQTEAKRYDVLQTLYTYTGTPTIQKTFWGGETVYGANLDSNACVLKLLQDNGISVTGTSKWDLAPHRGHPLVQTVIEYRKASKSLSAFLYPLSELIHPATGRLHPQYIQLVAHSGRMSCCNPNIQQIPRATSFRECFTAPPERRLVIADYSQIELRVAAQVSGDERMCLAFQKGEDLHLLTASYIANKPMELVSKQERQAYKAVNLGFIYGMGAKGLQTAAEMSYGINMSLGDATLFRKRFFDAYRGIALWHRDVMNASSDEGRTLTGRRFTFRKAAGLPERSNLPVQGTAADIIKNALGLLVDRIDSETKIVAVVHDEILIECPESRTDEAASVLKSAMEEAVNSILPDVPTTVEPVVSASWAEK
jgi:DNA polymerase-1